MESKLSKKGLVFPLQLAAQTHLVERTGWLEVTPGQVVVLVPFTTHRSGNLKICHVPNSFNNLKHTHTHTHLASTSHGTAPYASMNPRLPYFLQMQWLNSDPVIPASVLCRWWRV